MDDYHESTRPSMSEYKLGFQDIFFAAIEEATNTFTKAANMLTRLVILKRSSFPSTKWLRKKKKSINDCYKLMPY